MLRRLSDIKPDVEKRLRELGFSIKPGRFLVEAEKEGELHVVDVRETTGPVGERLLATWLSDIGEARAVLVAMGFFTKRALAKVVLDQDLRRRVALFWVGLKDWSDEVFKPFKLQLGPATPVSEAVEEALAARGVVPKPAPCEYCTLKAISACSECYALLCKEHFMPCALCRAPLCHPSAGRCFFSHKC
jgi:hypothetical protein